MLLLFIWKRKIDMKIVGYIVQFYDEDSVAPQGTGKLLFRNFQDAKQHAIKIAKKWENEKYDPRDGYIEWHNVQQKPVDDLLTGLVFTSPNVLIWIEAVYEN